MADKTIFVGGLSFPFTPLELWHYFSHYGQVVRITIKAKGYGFVEFASVDAAQRLILMQERHFKGYRIVIGPARRSVIYVPVCLGVPPAWWP